MLLLIQIQCMSKIILWVCMDEKPIQFFASARKSLHSKDGRIEYKDIEYIRNGTASILFTEPLNGWRFAAAQEHRTRLDWAGQIDWLLNEQYPDAKKVVLVMDNLNTHSIASLYQAFEPEKAFALANRLEIHYTPKHGSWLNIAEIELSALLSPWAANHKQRGVVWHFFVNDARANLKQLYPILNF